MLISSLICASMLTVATPATDSPAYWNKAWRDSASEYRGRVEAYHQLFYSYDWAMTFTMPPVLGGVAGGWYVDKLKTGMLFSVAEIACIAAPVFGIVRFALGKPTLNLNAGLILGGVFGFIGVKWLEISNYQHTVSDRNESLVEKYKIEIPDIMPSSIRYPTKEWPDWITATPEARHARNARKAIDEPLPTSAK
jgi:hypothetical protein